MYSVEPQGECVPLSLFLNPNLLYTVSKMCKRDAQRVPTLGQSTPPMAVQETWHVEQEISMIEIRSVP